LRPAWTRIVTHPSEQSEGAGQDHHTPFYHASLIERPDAPPDQHAAVSAMNDDDQGPLMCGSVAAALFSATAFTAARLYCSAVVLNRTRREDVIILLSLVSEVDLERRAPHLSAPISPEAEDV